MRKGARLGLVLAAVLAPVALLAGAAEAASCQECHETVTKGVVIDWLQSRHAMVDVTCDTCHGADHNSADDVAKATMPTPDTCAQCHEQQTAQYKKGKHALAWAALNAMPTTHAMPKVLSDGLKGCGGCHKVGLMTPEQITQVRGQAGGSGTAACDSCHTRHTFSKAEAREPEACRTCHMGFDHPQWEMYSGSKHGVRHALKRAGVLPASAAAPTCQTCHMQDGDHEVRTPWGFLAVRLPLPDDPQWKADQITILQALGVLDPAGKPTARLDVVKAAQVARLDQASFDAERAKLVKVCTDCHSKRFADAQMAAGDETLRNVDHLLAEAIREITALYTEGVLKKPDSYAYAFPDLLTFHDSPTPIENRLFVMHLKHRMRAFQGAFHANPDYALWYGWSEMVRDLADIRYMAEELRAKKK
jgi:hypothetical protein